MLAAVFGIKAFRSYLLTREFQSDNRSPCSALVTDSQAASRDSRHAGFSAFQNTDFLCSTALVLPTR